MTHTNISNFEAEKPRMTYAAIDSMISKYRQIVNEHTYNGQSLIMEGTDNINLVVTRDRFLGCSYIFLLPFLVIN